jgi:hypothetical protein
MVLVVTATEDPLLPLLLLLHPMTWLLQTPMVLAKLRTWLLELLVKTLQQLLQRRLKVPVRVAVSR